MDSNQFERERGITIASKYTSFQVGGRAEGAGWVGAPLGVQGMGLQLTQAAAAGGGPAPTAPGCWPALSHMPGRSTPPHSRPQFQGHTFNAVDTPGHADFGGEVER